MEARMIRHKGYSVNFVKGYIRRERDCMPFKFRYSTDGVVFPKVEQNSLPAYIQKWIISNAEDFLFSD